MHMYAKTDSAVFRKNLGPSFDRIDIHIEVASVKYNDLENEEEGEKSSVIRERVNRTRKYSRKDTKDLAFFPTRSLHRR